MGESFATSFAANLASKLAEYLIAPIGRQFGYVLCYKSNVKALENGVKELENAKKRVQSSVDEAVYDGKHIHIEVEDWLKSVKEEIKKADDLLKRGQSVKDACFCGWLPNPVVRHPIGRKVKKITKVIQRLQDKSKGSFFLKVYYENTPKGIIKATPFTARSVHRKDDVLPSRASLTEDVLNAIADDKVCVIGVHGPGGVGKSKLMEDIERQVREDKLFNVVATTNVSRNPDLKRIQGEIAYALGLNLMNEETALGRADRLCKRLEQDSEKKILIILDNLWTKLELKKVGIPCGDNNKARGCKLLLTSRYRHVLYADMGCDREFKLNELEHGEAKILFERTVGDRVNDPRLKSLVDGVVKNCGGLPLLIFSVATRLKHGDVVEWRDALTNIEGSSVKSIVELNYNDLKEERIKSLFLICALDDGKPSIRDTLVYCMGLGLYKTVSKTIDSARDKLIIDLRCLRDSSLLMGSAEPERFSMHDLFIDVAISMHDKFIDTEWNALVGRKDSGFKEWSKYDLRKCTAMAFNYVGIDELPKKLDCPNMRILLLLEHNLSLKIPESFFASMEKLQVLDITGLSFTSLPSSMELLGNLKSLCLDSCHLEDVTVLGKLKGLQFLSFINSRITRLPKEIGGLTELRFLDLRSCTGVEVIEPGVLGSLVNLEELYMDHGFDRWEADDEAPRSNASLGELKNMKKLSTLHITIPHAATLPTGLQFGKLNRHYIEIGCGHWWTKYRESRTLKLKLDYDNLLVEKWMQRCLEITEDLYLEILQGGKNSIHDLCFEGFQELKHLHVKNSFSFEYVVSPTANAQRPAFTKLESLFVENLNNLKKICCICLAPESFSKLKIMKVDKCDEITHLFPLSMMEILPQLEELEISSCHLMQQVFRDVEADEIVDDPTVKSCNLLRLKLQNLPTMTSFSKIANNSVVFFNGQQPSFPRLESLTLAELPKLEEIWDSQYPSEVSNLKFLEVKGCTSLSSIIPSNLLIKLQNLEAITVEKCQLVREVFDLEELTPSENVEILGQLTRLTLNGLPRLDRIWNKNQRGALCFQNLKALKVQNCENLRFLFSSSMAKALVQIKEIEVASCVLMEEIMDMQEEESNEVPTTDTLEFPLLTSLSLLELPNLRTFSHGKYYINCPSLTKLTISSCPKMMTFASLEGRQQLTTSDAGFQQAFDRINSSLSLPSFFNEKVEFPNMESMKISHMDNMKKIWPDDLASNAFSKLKTLAIEHCEKLPSIFSSHIILTRFQNLEELTVTNCESLEVVCHSQEFNISGTRSLSAFQLRELVLKRLPKMKHVWSGLAQGGLIFGRLKHIAVVECESLKNLFPSLVAKSMTHLEDLEVQSCGVEEIIAEEDGVAMSAGDLFFPQLTKLTLVELPKLKSFFRNSHTSRWPLLECLRVRHCEKMRSFSFPCEIQSCQGTVVSENQSALFSFEKVMPRLRRSTLTREDVVMTPQHYTFPNLIWLWLSCYHDENVDFPSDFLLHRFPNLEILFVECSSFEEIFPEDASGLGGATPCGGLTHAENPLQALGNLWGLYLAKLYNLRRVWKDGSLMAEILNQIKYLSIEECPSLSILFPSPISFQRLTYLVVKNCVGLVHVVTCSAATSLVHLQSLTLINCGAIEEVVTDDGKGATEISFPWLHSLTLDRLPSLESFSPTDCAFRFPSLRWVTVKQCPKLNIFCKGALRTPELHELRLFSDNDYEERWEGDLNTTIRTLST